MSYVQVIEKINKQVKNLGYSNEITFLEYASNKNLAQYVSSLIPYGKVFILSSEERYSESVEELRMELKCANLRPTTVVLKKVKHLRLEDISPLFCLSEDIRFLIVVDTDLAEIGNYFSTVKNVPVLFIIHSFDFGKAFASTVSVLNGDSMDVFSLSSKRIFAVDEQGLEQSSVCNGVATIGAKISALIDYKINSALTGKDQNVKYVESVEDALDSFNEFNLNDKRAVSLNVFYSTVVAELGRFINNGEFNNCSSAVWSARLFAGGDGYTAVAEFFSAKKIIECYFRLFSNNEKGETIPDYKLVAEMIGDATKQGRVIAGRNVLKKLSILNDYSGGVERIITLLKNSARRAKKEFGQVEKIYLTLGGKKTYCPNKIAESVQYSGYAGKAINGMTLFCEKGYSVKKV